MEDLFKWSTEFWKLLVFIWPLILSIIIWIVIRDTPQPPQRRLEEKLVSDIIPISTLQSQDTVNSCCSSTAKFKSFDDHSISLKNSTKFGGRRKKFNFRRSRFSPSMSFGSFDAYFGRSKSSSTLNRLEALPNFEDSGHSSLQNSVESLPAVVDLELVELRKFTQKISEYLSSLSPGWHSKK